MSFFGLINKEARSLKIKKSLPFLIGDILGRLLEIKAIAIFLKVFVLLLERKKHLVLKVL